MILMQSDEGKLFHAEELEHEAAPSLRYPRKPEFQSHLLSPSVSPLSSPSRAQQRAADVQQSEVSPSFTCNESSERCITSSGFEEPNREYIAHCAQHIHFAQCMFMHRNEHA